ncbi:MAG: nicotinate-nucleotide--dimethylbenzimidazole phosphoribosyltransferase [Nitrospinae bacterium]|nr:nicotinate-nucleotide--dimethylbenzimidazole phosphoribosyltransferase [Nitrospinota bacterium]
MKRIEQYIAGIEPVNTARDAEVQAHLNNLTKPLGSLGRLEDFAARFIRASDSYPPRLKKKAIYIMAADHGVCAEGVSAFPAEVTPQMVLNFLRGGAGINVLARHTGCETVVVDMGVNYDFENTPGLVNRKVAKGSKNIAKEAAMTEKELEQAIFAGIGLAEEAAKNGVDIIGTGDMGIGNTTPSTALYAAMLGLSPDTIVGPGTGLDAAGIARKTEVLNRILALHTPFASPLDALRKVGGLEIAGLTGLILGAAKNRIPVVVDGFISMAAAIVAIRSAPPVHQRVFFAHFSAERGHRRICEEVGVKPILDLDMRLGEGTGAALAIGIIEASVKIYNEMATFGGAGVSTAL